MFTILTKRLVFTGKFDITKDLYFKMYLKEFDFNIDKIVDSEIGDIIGVSIIKALIGLFEGFIKNLLNLVTSRGFSLKWIFSLLHLTWLTLEETLLAPYDGYFILYVTPSFNLETMMQQTFLDTFFEGADPMEWYLQSLRSVDNPDEITISKENLMDIKNSIQGVLMGLYEDDQAKAEGLDLTGVDQMLSSIDTDFNIHNLI